jgi:hypothetical protein
MEKRFSWLSSMIVLSVTTLAVVSLWPMKEPTEKMEVYEREEQQQKRSTDEVTLTLSEILDKKEVDLEAVAKALQDGATDEVQPEPQESINVLYAALRGGKY